MKPSVVIAIDGPAGSGKGTIAKLLAKHFDYALLDTGALYRAVAFSVIKNGSNPQNSEICCKVARSLDLSLLDDPALRTDNISVAASKVAAISEVRIALLDLQRHFASKPPDGKTGAILDGRDIGTVVCPKAKFKLFITAELEIRANRRFKQLLDSGETAIYARVLDELKERDARDINRLIAPLCRAADAMILDTSGLDSNEAFEKALALIHSRAYF